MPKSIKNRCIRHWSPRGPQSSSVGAAGNLLFSTPRKVSFEDSRSDSDSSISSDDPHTSSRSLQQHHNEGSAMRRKRSLLVRPITSLSLVDLAKSAAEEEQQSDTAAAAVSTDEEEVGEPKAKRICSPRSAATTAIMDQVPTSPQAGPRASPWGQFVDMLVPEEEDSSCNNPSLVSPYHCYSELSCNSSSSNTFNACRSRRSSPYGDYYVHKRNHHNRALTRKSQSPPSYLHLNHATFAENEAGHESSGTASSFRLTPRKKNPKESSTEQFLIGAFSDLIF